jgi:CheY-like chemotaxis protein
MSQASPRTGSSEEPVETILVVEDDVLIRLAVAEYLRDCGYRVFEATSMAEAKKVLNADAPVDLVFSDVNLRGKQNGFMLATWIREHYPDTQVLLTSGIVNATEKASDLCDHAPIPKPYTHEVVLQRIQALLAKPRKPKRSGEVPAATDRRASRRAAGAAAAWR